MNQNKRLFVAAAPNPFYPAHAITSDIQTNPVSQKQEPLKSTENIQKQYLPLGGGVAW